MKQEEKDFRDEKILKYLENFHHDYEDLARDSFLLGWNLSHRYSRDKNKNGSSRVKKV